MRTNRESQSIEKLGTNAKSLLYNKLQEAHERARNTNSPRNFYPALVDFTNILSQSPALTEYQAAAAEEGKKSLSSLNALKQKISQAIRCSLELLRNHLASKPGIAMIQDMLHKCVILEHQLPLNGWILLFELRQTICDMSRILSWDQLYDHSAVLEQITKLNEYKTIIGFKFSPSLDGELEYELERFNRLRKTCSWNSLHELMRISHAYDPELFALAHQDLFLNEHPAAAVLHESYNNLSEVLSLYSQKEARGKGYDVEEHKMYLNKVWCDIRAELLEQMKQPIESEHKSPNNEALSQLDRENHSARIKSIEVPLPGKKGKKNLQLAVLYCFYHEDDGRAKKNGIPMETIFRQVSQYIKEKPKELNDAAKGAISSAIGRLDLHFTAKTKGKVRKFIRPTKEGLLKLCH